MIELPLFVPCEQHDFKVRMHIKQCEEVCDKECATYCEHAAVLGSYRGVKVPSVDKFSITDGINQLVDYDTVQHMEVFRSVR